MALLSVLRRVFCRNDNYVGKEGSAAKRGKSRAQGKHTSTNATTKKGTKNHTGSATRATLEKLLETEEMLTRKLDFLEANITKELNAARSVGMRNKRRALQALRRKRGLEAQVSHITGVLTAIQNQRALLEDASLNANVLGVLDDCAKTLRAKHRQIDVNRVHELMDDVAEQQEVAGEIARAIANPTGGPFDADEKELLEELEQINQAELTRMLVDASPPKRSPMRHCESVPVLPRAYHIAAPPTAITAATRLKPREKPKKPVPMPDVPAAAALRRRRGPTAAITESEGEELAHLEKWARGDA